MLITCPKDFEKYIFRISISLVNIREQIEYPEGYMFWVCKVVGNSIAFSQINRPFETKDTEHYWLYWGEYGEHLAKDAQKFIYCARQKLDESDYNSVILKIKELEHRFNTKRCNNA